MGLLLSALSLLCTAIIIPVLCVLEYYSGMKMGMYRYFVLKNSWWLKNVFMPEMLPVIFAVSVILASGGIYFSIRMFRRSRSAESLRIFSGLLILSGNFYVFMAGNFTKLNTAPFSALACIGITVLYSAGSFITFTEKKKYLP